MQAKKPKSDTNTYLWGVFPEELRGSGSIVRLESERNSGSRLLLSPVGYDVTGMILLGYLISSAYPVYCK